MLMPGRGGYKADAGWVSGGGTTGGIVDHLTVNHRTGNTPATYKAQVSIEFVEGFETGTGDSFEALILDANNEENDNAITASGAAGYRYGFNGKENDHEPKGIEGSQQDYGMRIYDPRVGRFLSVDPLASSFQYESP